MPTLLIHLLASLLRESRTLSNRPAYLSSYYYYTLSLFLEQAA